MTDGNVKVSVLENGSTKITDFDTWSKKKSGELVNLDDLGLVSALNKFDPTKNAWDTKSVRAKSHLINTRNQAFASKDFTT